MRTSGGKVDGVVVVGNVVLVVVVVVDEVVELVFGEAPSPWV